MSAIDATVRARDLPLTDLSAARQDEIALHIKTCKRRGGHVYAVDAVACMSTFSAAGAVPACTQDER